MNTILTEPKYLGCHEWGDEVAEWLGDLYSTDLDSKIEELYYEGHSPAKAARLIREELDITN